MRRYQVTAPITLYAGVIGLSSTQAVPRMRSLQERSQGDGFDITGTVQFCAGEVILLDPAQIQAVVHSLLELDVDPEKASAVVEKVEKKAVEQQKAKARKKAGTLTPALSR